MTQTDRRADWPGWITTALGMLWLGLFPLWQDGSYSRITRSKWIGMLLLTGVTLLVCGHMLARLSGKGKLRQIRISGIQCAAMIYFALVALSAWQGSYADRLNDSGQLTVLFGARRYEGLITQLCYFAIFLCLSLAPVKVDWLLTAAADALLIFCGFTALQYQGVNVLSLFPEGLSIHTNYEFQGTIGNIDMVTGYASLVVPALLAGFTLKGSVLWLTSGLAGVLLMLCMEVQSGLIVLALLAFALLLLSLYNPHARWRTMLVLGGMLAMVSLRLLLGLPWLDDCEVLSFPHALALWKLLPLGAGLFLALTAGLLRRWPGPGVRLRWVTLTAVLLILAVLAAAYFAPLPQGSGLWELQELLHGRAQDAFGSERIGVWRLTLEMSRDNLLLGTGPDTFLYAMDDHLYHTGQTLVQHFDNPHNMLLAVLANNGLPAMLAFAALCIWALLAGMHALRRRPMLTPLLLAAACYLAQGMFTFSICLVTPMFWAMLGMLTAGVYAPSTTERMEKHDPDYSQL